MKGSNNTIIVLLDPFMSIICCPYAAVTVGSQTIRQLFFEVLDHLFFGFKRVFGFWSMDKFWGQIVMDSSQ